MRRLTIRTGMLLGVMLIAALGTWLFHARAMRQFESAYVAYAAAAQKHDDAAYIPGHGENPIRRAISKALSEALVGEITDGERAALAREGLKLLKESEKEIDAMTTTGEYADAAIEDMEAQADNIGHLYAEDDIRHIIELSRERSRIIADVRGLSYRANYDMAKIFERIIDDGGALTPAHAADLNRQIPAAEAQFDERSNLYLELEHTSEAIESAHAHLIGE